MSKTKLGCIGLGIALAAACSGSSGEGSTSDSDSGGNDGTGGGALFDPNMDAGNGDIKDRFGDLIDSACAVDTARGEALPAVLQLVVDTSGSMGRRAPGSNRTKWEVTRDALNEAIDNMPPTAAIGVVLYPNRSTQPGGPCFRSQSEVSIDLLGASGSAQRNNIRQALAGADPEGGTPTHDAYQFALGELDATTLPGNRFIVLITDGTPTFALNCNGTGSIDDPVDSQPIINESTGAFQDGVRTFVIGSPGSEDARDALSEIASEGGTAQSGCSSSGPNYCHFDMTTEPDLATALRDALTEITGQAVSCNYVVPTGGNVDPNKVIVVYTPGSGDPEEILKDPSQDQCNTGWQYAQSRTQIELCGSTCDRIKADQDGQIDLIFGCETNVDGPR